MVDGVPSYRKFSDHKAIMARMRLIPVEMRKMDLPAKFIKTSESRAKFSMLTEEIAE